MFSSNSRIPFILTSLCLGLSFLALIIYIVGFSCPNWLQKDYQITVPGSVLSLPAPFDTMEIPLQISTNAGLFRACREIVLDMPPLPKKVTNGCDTKGVKDWQYVAGGFAIAALVFAVASFGLCVAILIVTKEDHNRRLRLATFCCHVLTTCCMLVPIIQYSVNTVFLVNPPRPDKEDFDFSWAIFVAITSLVLYGILTFLSLLLFVISAPEKKKRVDLPIQFVKETSSNNEPQPKTDVKLQGNIGMLGFNVYKVQT